MKKMEMPQMDVVRFKESDVIVASGTVEVRYARLSDWGGQAHDASLNITISGNTYNHDWENLNGQYEQHLLRTEMTFTNNVNTTKSLGDLMLDDVNNGAFDGYYISKDDGWSYKWINQ